MKKFLIISAVFVVLVLGLVAQQHNVEIEEVQVAPNTIENVRPRLTKSQKIEQNYQPSQNPTGEIPVIFEQVAAADIAVKSTDKPAVALSQLQAVAPAALLKTEPNMNESINLLAHQVAGQMVPTSHLDQSEPEMGACPFGTAPDQYHQKFNPVKPVTQNQPQELLQDQSIAAHGQDEPRSSKRFNRPYRSSTYSYQPTSVATDLVTPDVPAEQKLVEAPVEQPSQAAVKPSLFGRVKNGLSKIPKLLYGLPLVAGAYAMLKNAPGELEVPVKPESEKIDVAGNVHDKLKEVQDEYLKDQAAQDQQPAAAPGALKVPYQQTPALEQELPAVAAQDSVKQDPVPTALDPKSYIAPQVSGAFSPTRTLLSPVRSLDQVGLVGQIDRVDQAPEVSTPAIVETVVIPAVPAAPIVSTLDVAAPRPGMARKAFNDCYSYFARRLSSPMGVLALATKAAAIGLQIAPMAYAVRQAQALHSEELMLEGAIAQVVRTMKPIDVQLLTASVVPVEGASSYIAQLASGNAAAVAQQLAAQCATLRLR